MLDRPSPAIRDRIDGLVRQVIADNELARPERIAASLREAGLTSLDTVKLVLSIEREFNITIEPDDFEPENFETLDTVEALLTRRGVEL